MRAWQVHELGEPRDVLALAEVPEPELGPGQVLVRTPCGQIQCTARPRWP